MSIICLLLCFRPWPPSSPRLTARTSCPGSGRSGSLWTGQQNIFFNFFFGSNIFLHRSVYYAHHVTASTQWTHPRTGKKKCVSAELPFGWERVIEHGNKVVYVDNINKRTTFTDPRLAFAKEIAGQKDTNSFRQKHDAGSSAGHVLHGRDLTGLGGSRILDQEQFSVLRVLSPG